MKRSSSSTSSMSSTYSSDSKAFGAPNRQADLPISRIHGHHRSEGNALLRPPSRAEANHRRIVSMPDTSNHGPHRPVDWNYSSSDGSAERNFGTGSPPIFDFTTFEDRYRNSSSTGLHNSFLVVTPSSKDGRRVVSDQGIGIKRQSAGDSSIAPTSTSWPDFDMILETLEDIIAEDSVRWNFDLEELIDNRHQQELRDNLPVKASRKLTVFSRPLSEVVQYASKAIFFGNGRTGTSLSLPLVIISCVEELYRTGIYQPNLFRTLPNRSRLLDLISIFDSMDRAPSIKCNTRQKSSTQEEFGANVSLQLEATADICALFTSYLSALPESLVPAHIFDAIWVLCDLEVTPSISKDPSFEIDATRQTPSILLAQLLLHLLPPPNFSLLVYLLAFFSQTVLANEENGVDIRDLVKMFGARLFGNGVSPVAPSSHSMPNSKGNSQDPLPTSPARGEIMMAWFLRRWATIIDSLFEVVEDAKMGVYRRNKRLRKDSLGRPTLQRRREKTLKSCSRLAKVLSEGDTTAGTPKKQSKTRLQPQKAMTLDGPSLQASLSAFKFPVAALPHLRSEAKIISPTTVVVPQSGLYSIGTGLNLQSKAANEGPGHRAQLKTPRVAPSRFRSELKGSAQPPSLHSDSQYRLPDDDYFSYDNEPAEAPSIPSATHRNACPPPIHRTCPSENNSGYSPSQTGFEDLPKKSLPPLVLARSESARDRFFYAEEDLQDKFVDQAPTSVRGSTILQFNPNSRDLLDDLLLEVTMPTFPSSSNLGLDSTVPLSRQKAIHKTKTPNRRSTIDSSAISDSSKKLSLPASSGRSHIPLPSMRRTQSKTEQVIRTPDRHKKDSATTKDEEIRKLRLMIRKVEKERDEAVHVLGEVQKMLGAV